MSFLPVTRDEMYERGWERPDFILITGDAYVDHPSFGGAIISRVLESRGYRIAILPQPDWRSTSDFKKFGRPRLGFLITSGNVDSMVNHYTVRKRPRRNDSYSPGGKAGNRPDRATIVYANKVKEAYRGIPIILGGLEASLRRMAHYDYWDDKIRRSILLDSGADLIVYGMGEKAIVQVAEALDNGIDIEDITWIRGTVWKKDELREVALTTEEKAVLPSFDQLMASKKAYANSFRIQYQNNNHRYGRTLVESYRGLGGRIINVIQNPPDEPIESMDLDDIYELPYERNWHPMYDGMGGVPALEEVKFSITANRGCFGGCAFCALTYHQGREVRGRSKDSVMREARILIDDKDFKGYIHDVGGPTANFHNPACVKQGKDGVCVSKDCMFPKPCRELIVDHGKYLDLLRGVRGLAGVKKVFIRSGVRYDYLMADKNGEFLRELCEHHISGRLKVAPEHVSPKVLAAMRKAPIDVFNRFYKEFNRVNKELGKEQYLIPYFISSHPGSKLEDAVQLALFLKDWGFVPDQVQDFYPTPGTLATCMYYTGMDPLTGKEIYVAKSPEEKQMQRALLQFNKKENKDLVRGALARIGRKDLESKLLGKTVKTKDTRWRK
ncbi:MAG: YgiQ family radical SAM protein [Anaerovoracaceae bacterium]|jgi:uncharacterized radical SAM protein YgiQ